MEHQVGPREPNELRRLPASRRRQPGTTRPRISIVLVSSVSLLVWVVNGIGCSGPDEAVGAAQPTQTSTVRGTVTAASGGQPVAGVLVQCGGVTYSTGDDGRYSLSNVPRGNQSLVAEKSGFERYSRSIEVESPTVIHDVSLVTAVTGSSVGGYVYDYETYDPVRGTRVQVLSLTDYTDSSGRYQLSPVPEGQQTITVSSEELDYPVNTASDDYFPKMETFYMSSSSRAYDVALLFKNWQGTWVVSHSCGGCFLEGSTYDDWELDMRTFWGTSGWTVDFGERSEMCHTAGTIRYDDRTTYPVTNHGYWSFSLSTDCASPFEWWYSYKTTSVNRSRVEGTVTQGGSPPSSRVVPDGSRFTAVRIR